MVTGTVCSAELEGKREKEGEKSSEHTELDVAGKHQRFAGYKSHGERNVNLIASKTWWGDEYKCGRMFLKTSAGSGHPRATGECSSC